MPCEELRYVRIENIGRNASSYLGVGITERFPSHRQSEERFLSVRSQFAEGHVCKIFQEGLTRKLNYMCGDKERLFIGRQCWNGPRMSIFPRLCLDGDLKETLIGLFVHHSE
jgi:hypothetical protein